MLKMDIPHVNITRLTEEQRDAFKTSGKGFVGGILLVGSIQRSALTSDEVIADSMAGEIEPLDRLQIWNYRSNLTASAGVCLLKDAPCDNDRLCQKSAGGL